MRSAAVRRLQGSAKPQSAQAPLCGFTPPIVWAGVNAPHCPIACPNRRIQPERYVPFFMKYIFFVFLVDMIYDLILEYYKIMARRFYEA
jgi:hypothetical protein